MIGTITGGAVVLVGIAALTGFRTIRPTHRVVVETFGKFTKTFQPGLHWIIPLVQSTRYINTTEQMMDIQPQDIITQDNLNAIVDLQVYYKVKKDEENLKKSLYDVEDFETQVTNLAQTTARNVIGAMKFVDVNSKRNKLNEDLKKALDTQSDNWGVDVVRVEMKEIAPPKDVQESMNKIIKAENEKDAANDLATAAETRADGERRSSIKKAEGIKQSLILEADGRASAIKTVANANAEKIKVVNQSIQKNFKGTAKEYKALETTEKSLQNGSKYVIDSKSNIMNVMSEASGVVIPTRKKV